MKSKFHSPDSKDIEVEDPNRTPIFSIALGRGCSAFHRHATQDVGLQKVCCELHPMGKTAGWQHCHFWWKQVQDSESSISFEHYASPRRIMPKRWFERIAERMKQVQHLQKHSLSIPSPCSKCIQKKGKL